MAFTWNGNPRNSTIEAIRFEINDIVEAKAKFTDAEIEYAYSIEKTILGASARLCEILAAKYAEEASRSLGPLRVELGSITKNYSNKAKELRKRATAYGTPYCGNISKEKAKVFEEDSDINQPVFKKDLMTND
jgi:hypothetical protein